MRFEFSSLLSPAALGVLLLVVLGVFAVLSVAFIYHWRTYGMNTQLIRLATPLYLIVSGVLAASAIISYLTLL